MADKQKTGVCEAALTSLTLLQRAKDIIAQIIKNVNTWRREGDSNSRSRLPQTNDLANRPLQPLGYPSGYVLHTIVPQILKKCRKYDIIGV